MPVSSDVRVAAEAVMPDVVSVTVEPLTGGSSAFVAALTLESTTGKRRRVVFRQHIDTALKSHSDCVAFKEFHLTRLLADEGLDVARPLALHQGQPCDGPWLVTEWVEGTTEVAASDVDAALSQMADSLVRLHRVDVGDLDALGITAIEDPVEALPKYLLDDDVGRSVLRVISDGVERRPNPSGLLHGDFWPGNVLFRSGRLVAVLDWEDATWGDPLVDLACARVELECAYGVGASERFSAAYLESGQPVDQHDLPLWDAYVSATALSSMHLWGLPPTAEAARRRTTRQFLQAAVEQIRHAAPS